MQYILRVIKRKKNLRRLSAVWLLLIAIELLCPAFGDERTYAATNLTPAETTVSVNNTPDKDTINSENSLSSSDNQYQNYQPTTVCNDECLCHATAIPNLVIPTIKPPTYPSERIVFLFGNPVHTSLPPPFHPPKIS
jgi:hypothetical protein